ncbi:hypothetical protein ACFVXE_37445 [Streptomyces sp. NPDC058231]|uniref:hypothetical protein n=1 Tax=Streptomyces sp. NPDC058231 TaxID=3346392 RepID=UPI0036E2B94C
MNDVRELLGRAAEQAGQPVISTEGVYARAARVRWRRRATVAAAAFAVITAGAVAVPGLAAQSKQRQERSSVAAPPERTGNSGRAKQLVELLPGDVGAVEQVSLAMIIKGATAAQAEEHPLGPLDGQYAVRRDGGVGYLTVDFRSGEQIRKKSGGADPVDNICKPATGPRPADCVREVLPGGRVLTIWSDAMNYDGTPKWGFELVGRLVRKDGGTLAVRDSTGFRADSALGPLLKNTPVTRAQLRTLMLSQELQPKG